MFLKILFICLFFIFSTAAVYALVRFYNKILKVNKDSDIIQEDIEKVPEIQKFQSLTKRAVVLCSSNKIFDFKKYDYIGQKDCFLFQKFYDSPYLCPVQCFGFGSCVASCPENAIIIQKNTATITKFCTGCGKCLTSCPTNCIRLYSLKEYPDISKIDLCANEDSSYKNCSVCKAKFSEQLVNNTNEVSE